MQNKTRWYRASRRGAAALAVSLFIASAGASAPPYTMCDNSKSDKACFDSWQCLACSEDGNTVKICVVQENGGCTCQKGNNQDC